MRDVFEQVVAAAHRHGFKPDPWGFYIFRTTYGDQELWTEYINHIHNQALRFLATDGYGPPLRPHLHFTTVEDRPVLEGRSKEQVRQVFRTMLDGFPPQGDAARRIPPKHRRDTPRFNCFLYVDDQCLQSFAGWQKIGDENFWCGWLDAFVIVVTKDDDDGSSWHPDDRREEGEDYEDRLWMALECESISDLYDELTCNGRKWAQDWPFWPEVKQSSEEKMRPWRTTDDGEEVEL